MYTLGIDIGASSIKIAAVNEFGQIVGLDSRVHAGTPVAVLRSMLEDVLADFEGEGCANWVTTGSSAAVINEYTKLNYVLEDVPAIVGGASLLVPEARSIIQIGAQTSLFITSSAKAGEDPWNVSPVFSMNESCASGTGSFFEDQMGRLGLDIADYSKYVSQATSIPRLSGRCSVFAKTDIIHKQQEGVSKEDILLGLCYAMVKSYKTGIVKGLEVKKPVALCGGVLKNVGVLSAIKDVFKLEEEEILHAQTNVYMQAIGAALYAQRKEARIAHIQQLVDALATQGETDALPRLEALPQIDYVAGEGYVKTEIKNAPLRCALGIDVGSTSTNLVLINEDKEIIDAQYLRTAGSPKEVVLEGLKSIEKRLGESIEIIAVGTTGSGRSLIGRAVGADAIRDEITAQAKAAVNANPYCDTVFEIGGQDSKYIALSDGQVVDFQMNKICAAGTGSFVEEQAARLDIPLETYGKLALSAKSPIDLGERCTVFVETAINTALSKGASKADIAAGLCLSIIKNYIHRVVGTKQIGQHIVLQGGVNYNAGIVAAFKSFFGDRVTVSPWFAVSGACGVALLAMEEQPQKTAFRGYNMDKKEAALNKTAQQRIAENHKFFSRLDDLFLEGYNPKLDPEKKTVGIPRCLMLHKLFPMANAFFTKLGYNVIISDETNEEIIGLSEDKAQGETCFPVKLVYGHMEQLVKKKVDYVFMPSAHTIRHPASRVDHNYACPFMQSAPAMVARALHFEERNIKLLSPILEMDFGQSAIANALLGLGVELGHNPRDAARAMLAGGFAVREFTRKTEELGEELLASLKPDERVLVMITRNYGIVDPILNMGIPQALIDRGQKVITVSHLHAHESDISRDYPGLYWPFGQHIISGAKIIREDPRLFAVYLTNHGCGPDTMMTHLFEEEMQGKPYLQIEVDEHSSKVGVITRIEAFLNSLDHWQKTKAHTLKSKKESKAYLAPFESINFKLPIYVPTVGVYGDLYKMLLERRFAEQKSRGLMPCDAKLDLHMINIDRQAMKAGQTCLVSKEYASFTALMGAALIAAKQAQDGPAQFVMLSGQGSDADGMFARVVHSILRRKTKSKFKLVAPFIEQLPWRFSEEEFDQVFYNMIKGDIVMAAPVAKRAEVMQKMQVSEGSIDDLLDIAQEVAAMNASTKRLSVVGDPLFVYSDYMSEGIWKELEEKSYSLSRAPISEYCWFAWNEAYKADVKKKSKKPASEEKEPSCNAACSGCSLVDVSLLNIAGIGTSDEEKRQRLDKMAAVMKRVSDALGSASSFSDSLVELEKIGETKLPSLTAANGRYRLAKSITESRRNQGVITCVSMYENTDTVLKHVECADDFSAPLLHLSFEGTLSSDNKEKVHSFLYYI